MPYKNTQVSLTRSSSVNGIVNLQPQDTNACTSDHVPGLRIFLLFCFFPQGAIFEPLVVMLKAYRRDQNLSLKTNSTSRKGLHISLSQFWEEIRQKSWLFRNCTVSPEGTQEALAKFQFEWLYSAHLRVLLSQLQGLFVATSCPWVFCSLPLLCSNSAVFHLP